MTLSITAKPKQIYEFKLAEKVCDQFNNLINNLKKDEKLKTGEKYPWLDKTDERKYMTDREILEKYINLDNICLTEEERKKLWTCYINIKKCLV